MPKWTGRSWPSKQLQDVNIFHSTTNATDLRHSLARLAQSRGRHGAEARRYHLRIDADPSWGHFVGESQMWARKEHFAGGFAGPTAGQKGRAGNSLNGDGIKHCFCCFFACWTGKAERNTARRHPIEEGVDAIGEPAALLAKSCRLGGRGEAAGCLLLGWLGIHRWPLGIAAMAGTKKE